MLFVALVQTKTVIKVLEPRLNNTTRYQNLDVKDGHNL